MPFQLVSAEAAATPVKQLRTPILIGARDCARMVGACTAAVAAAVALRNVRRDVCATVLMLFVSVLFLFDAIG